METSNRGADHAARLIAAEAFLLAAEGDVDAGLAMLGPMEDPIRVRAALALLLQHDRNRDAADVVRQRDVDCKWMDLAIYALVANRETERALAFLQDAERK